MTNRHPHWELIEKFYGEWGKWECYCEGDYIAHPSWFPDKEYELRPVIQYKELNGIKYPAPETEKPKPGATYYYPVPCSSTMYSSYRWYDDEIDDRILSRDCLHLSPEHAIQHAKAMIGKE